MADRVIFVCTLLLAGVYFYATEQLPSLEIGDPLGPKAFPRLLVIALVITAIILLLEILRKPKTAPAAVAVAVAGAGAGAGAADPRERGAKLVVAGAAIWTLLYFLVFETLGFVVATTIYLLVLMAYFNRGKWVANVLTAVLFSLGSYLMFTQLLGVTLARGILPF
jgi:putative tricarboxylic transport membrane protein